MNIDIPSAVLAALTTIAVGAIITALIQYGAYKTRNLYIDERIIRIEKHLEFGDKRVDILENKLNDIHTLCAELNKVQVAHNDNDDKMFSQILDELKEMNKKVYNLASQK